jgi:hypothetical protein
MTRPSVRTHERNTRHQPPRPRTGQRAPLAWPYHCFPRDAGGNRTHLNRTNAARRCPQPVALPSGSSLASFSVLARSRAWSSTFAGSRARFRHTPRTFSNQCPAEELKERLAVQKTAVLSGTLAGQVSRPGLEPGSKPSEGPMQSSAPSRRSASRPGVEPGPGP